MDSRLESKVLRATVLNGLRLCVPPLVALCTSALIARTLQPTNMGVYSYALWLASLLTSLATLGLPTTLMKYVAEYKGRADEETAGYIAGKLFRLQIIAIPVVLVAAFGVCLATSVVQVFSLLGLLVALLVVPQVLHQASVGTLSGAQEYSKTLNAGLWAAVVQIVGVAAVALARGSVRSLLVVAFLASVVPAWLTSRAVVRFATPKSSLDSAPKQYARVQPRVRRFWLAASCTALIDLVIWQRSGLFFLKLFAPLPQLALYAIAFSISDRLSTIGAIMTGALMPLFSEIHANMDHERLFALYTKALKYVQMVMLPACLFGIIVARPIVYLLCGRSYAEAAPVLQVVLASLAVTGLGPVVYALILSVGKEMFLVRVGVPVAALNVVLSLLLIPRGWALGAAIANGSVQVVDTVLALLCAHRIAGHFPLRSFARICISGLAGAVPLLYICRTSMNDLGKLAFVIPAGLLYLLALTAWREIGEKEFNLFRRLVSSAVARRASSNPP